MIKEQRVAAHLLWKQTKEDNAHRAKITNKLKDFMGLGKPLATDDEATKARKRAGWKGSPWGRAIVGAGGSLPYGDPLPGNVKVPRDIDSKEGSYWVEVNRDWSDLVFPGDYIQINEQVFMVHKVGKEGMDYAQEQKLLKDELKKLEEEKMLAVKC
jgi:hypothetical protein